MNVNPYRLDSRMIRSYSIFAVPYGVFGVYSTASLQTEVESWTLSGSWVSVADTGASGGNAAKIPAGTLAANMPTITSPMVTLAPGTYTAWYRARIANQTGGSAQHYLLAVIDNVGGAFNNNAVYDNMIPTTYGAGSWINVGSNTNILGTGTFTAVAGRTYGFRIVNSGQTVAADMFFDEAMFVPFTLSTDNRGPQEQWQQFIADRTARMVRL